MANHLLILNGPNLNMLGQREADIYGKTSLADIQKACENKVADLGISCDFYQSNHEGEMVAWIQDAKGKADAIIINAAAYTHSSVAIRDALLAVSLPVIEIHLSNIYGREEFRHQSMISDIAKGVICGFGMQSYLLGIEAAAAL